MSIVGLDPERIGQLAGRRTTAASQAHGIRASIARIVANAECAALTGGYSATPPNSEPDGGALLAITRGAPPMSTDIKTRLKHLLACQTDGLPIDPILFFNDEAPPDPAKVKAAITFFNQHIDDSGGFLWSDSAQGTQEVLNDWKQLTPTELDAVINSLTPAQLKKLNGQLGEGASWWGAGDANMGVQLDFANLIYSETGPDAISKVDEDVPVLQPDSSISGVSGLQYQTVSGPLFPPGGVNVKNDLAQGEDGDCWFLSALGTVVMHDPGFLAQHIRENDNGTYTVTFYTNGKPVDITVDGTLPVSNTGGWADGLVYAHSGTTTASDENTSLWAAIYEKAYAQFKGGYGAIYGGYGAWGLENLTGKKATISSPGNYSLSQVARIMENGGVLTTGTKDDKSLWDKIFGGGPETEDSFNLVTSHEYMVKSVNLNSHPPTITVMNPWGSGGVEDNHVMPQEVTLTEQQWNEYFGEVSVGKS